MDNKDVYLRSDKQLSVNCDVDSNPTATCEWEFGSNKLNTSCDTELDIKNSILVNCTAKNSQYANDFDKESLNVIVVDANREL